MRKIKVFRPHIELRVSVSDEMIQDYRECEEMLARTGCLCKDCDTCSWGDAEIGDMKMCELKEARQLLQEEAEVKAVIPGWKDSIMRTFLGGRA